jgi:hypothetical protein
MTGTTLLEPLIAARLKTTMCGDGRLLVGPAHRITPEIRVYINAHLDDLRAEVQRISTPPDGALATVLALFPGSTLTARTTRKKDLPDDHR